MFTYQGIAISWLGHDGFRIAKEPLSIVIDPFRLERKQQPAQLVLVTHEHFDHCSVEDLRKVVDQRTTLICPEECLSKVSKLQVGEVVPMRPGEIKEAQGVSISAVAAYNVDKYRDPKTKAVFHPKEDEKIGYLLDIGGVRIYHAGDTDLIPEMGNVQCDIALLPVSGTYVMTAEEAAEAAKRIKPKVAIPMHYGAIVGTDQDAKTFGELLTGSGIQVEVLERA